MAKGDGFSGGIQGNLIGAGALDQVIGFRVLYSVHEKRGTLGRAMAHETAPRLHTGAVPVVIPPDYRGCLE